MIRAYCSGFYLLNSVVIAFIERHVIRILTSDEFRGLITVHVINGILSLTHPTCSIFDAVPSYDRNSRTASFTLIE